jgi:hypothetical protein
VQELEAQVERLLNRILQLELQMEAAGLDPRVAKAVRRPHDVRAPPPRCATDGCPL